MAGHLPFRELIDRVRAGNQEAATELFDRYESHVRRVARVRLTDSRLRRLMDSVDISQSVMAEFFVRTAGGQIEIDTPQQLLALLATMTRNKLINHAYKQQAGRRDHRRLEVREIGTLPIASADDTPSQIVGDKELLEEVMRRLVAEERSLYERRRMGYSWSEIAAELGGHADALRMRLHRALDRVCHELGFGEAGNHADAK